MLGLFLKVALTAAFIVALSEIGKRVPSLAGLIVALPLATAMTMVLMHLDGEAQAKISAFAGASLLFLPPSTVFVAVMWAGLAVNGPFWIVLASSLAATGGAFWAYAVVLGRFGVKLL
jgi:membrane protein YqaA with SNARE-associated domain